MNQLKKNLKEFIQYDNSIKEYENKIKQLKKKRQKYSDDIKNYMIQSNKKNISSKSKNIFLELKETNIKQSYSKKFLDENFMNFFQKKFLFTKEKSNKYSKYLLSFIDKNRNIQKKITLKQLTK